MGAASLDLYYMTCSASQRVPSHRYAARATRTESGRAVPLFYDWRLGSPAMSIPAARQKGLMLPHSCKTALAAVGLPPASTLLADEWCASATRRPAARAAGRTHCIRGQPRVVLMIRSSACRCLCHLEDDLGEGVALLPHRALRAYRASFAGAP